MRSSTPRRTRRWRSWTHGSPGRAGGGAASSAGRRRPACCGPGRVTRRSRAGDPNPHDHVLIANLTQMLDERGGWKRSAPADCVTWSTRRRWRATSRRPLSLSSAGDAITPDAGPSGKLDSPRWLPRLLRFPHAAPGLLWDRATLREPHRQGRAAPCNNSHPTLRGPAGPTLRNVWPIGRAGTTYRPVWSPRRADRSLIHVGRFFKLSRRGRT